METVDSNSGRHLVWGLIRIYIIICTYIRIGKPTNAVHNRDISVCRKDKRKRLLAIERVSRHTRSG